MNNYFSSNLKKLAQKHTQKEIAEKTGASPASITNYINGTNEPSLSFISQFKKAFNINIDDFIFKNLSFDQELQALSGEHKRFAGNYLIYYYDTSAYKGSQTLYTKNALNYGVISITNTAHEKDKPKAYAQFLLNRKEAETLLATLNQSSEKEIDAYFNNLSDNYVGSVSPNSSHIFLNLKNHVKNDECFMILNNPPSNKNYIGGIATVNSISRGREHMPCIQYAIMSRYSLNVTDGEIYNMLTLNSPEINVDLDVENLINLFKNLYINNADQSLLLTEYQKKRIIEESFKNTLEDLLETNLFKFAKISDMEDDRYYRIIKEEMFDE